jgi:hypothetical protein
MLLNGNCRYFSAMVRTAESRGKFIASAKGFISTHNLAGIDIDWECVHRVTLSTLACRANSRRNLHSIASAARLVLTFFVDKPTPTTTATQTKHQTQNNNNNNNNNNTNTRHHPPQQQDKPTPPTTATQNKPQSHNNNDTTTTTTTTTTGTRARPRAPPRCRSRARSSGRWPTAGAPARPTATTLSSSSRNCAPGSAPMHASLLPRRRATPTPRRCSSARR